jgi:hypothetical protein
MSKNFFWEVDADSLPDYYTMIKRPMMLCHVATSLSSRAYGDGDDVVTSSSVREPSTPAARDSDGDGAHPAPLPGNDRVREEHATTAMRNSLTDVELTIAQEFYNDMRQVFLNCIAYYSEMSPYASQAQKLLQALGRHSQRWLFGSSLPPLSVCDELSCLLSFQKVIGPPVFGSNTNFIRCSRCQAIVSLAELNRLSGSREESLCWSLILPTKDQIEHYTEEWFCPLCVREDFVTVYDRTSQSIAEDVDVDVFDVQEYGPSMTLPWVLNPSVCSVFDKVIQDSPSLQVLYRSLLILGNNALSQFETQADIGTSSNMPSWTLKERVYVAAALCEVSRICFSSLCLCYFLHPQSLKITKDASAIIERLFSDCQKLAKICEKQTFREADFIDTVRAVAGDDAATLCRSLLDGIVIENPEDGICQRAVVEGRCIICHRSTYLEDLQQASMDVDGENADDEEPETEQVILCDGCNAEAHLSCTSLDSVGTVSLCYDCSAVMRMLF